VSVPVPDQITLPPVAVIVNVTEPLDVMPVWPPLETSNVIEYPGVSVVALLPYDPVPVSLIVLNAFPAAVGIQDVTSSPSHVGRVDPLKRTSAGARLLASASPGVI
jgi:hypothetical protein